MGRWDSLQAETTWIGASFNFVWISFECALSPHMVLFIFVLYFITFLLSWTAFIVALWIMSIFLWLMCQQNLYSQEWLSVPVRYRWSLTPLWVDMFVKIVERSQRRKGTGKIYHTLRVKWPDWLKTVRSSLSCLVNVSGCDFGLEWRAAHTGSLWHRAI